jgi:hypothetical protein
MTTSEHLIDAAVATTVKQTRSGKRLAYYFHLFFYFSTEQVDQQRLLR